MLDQTIRRLLSLFPKGATDDQLVWRISASGIRLSASELLAGLGTLAQRGEIVRDAAGRWQVSRPREVRREQAKHQGRPGTNAAAASATLTAVEAAWHASPQSLSEESVRPGNSSLNSLPDWRPLLEYYAGTQRRDPRGRIEAFADRHGSIWQLIRLTGSWWSGASIRISTEILPEALVQALSRPNLSSPAIGWPVSIFPSPQGQLFMPALILPVGFRIEGTELFLDVETAEPALNPAWMREVCRHTSWKAAELTEQLFPEGEDNTIGTISDRMRHSLATIGGMTLRPGDLASEISLSNSGLRNAAALFLPEEGSFTKAVAEDIESIREWSKERLTNTALGAILSDTTPALKSDLEVNVISLGQDRALTDHQLDAAEAALEHGLTVIQGPPGSGKSEVITTLLASAVMAGQSVLFSARNHQAVDEVEKRLTAIVPDFPLLTRARDADGDRDISFLDALQEIANADVTTTTQRQDIETVNKSLCARAREHHVTRRRRRDETALHLALSELVERRGLISEHRPFPVRKGAKASLLHRLRLAVRRLAGRSRNSLEPLPDNASLRQIDDRIADLKHQLRLQLSAAEGTDSSASDSALLGKDVSAFLPKLAEIITKPAQGERPTIATKVKELAFNNVKSARRMPLEDAHIVLRYRPIWAVSTLSVPSRVPLAPGLFDYVIFDETSQSDIASAIPLLARAKKAIIVGDPMQLNFVRPLGTGTEHALMDNAGLPKQGRSSFAQSINSLFDFAANRPAVKRFLLADQFRSAPAIVDYLNEDFYNGQLIGRRWEEQFKPPSDYRPGLSWENVAGHETRGEGGPVNTAEAKRVAELLKKFAVDDSFKGSVGVISPFNAQVAEIQKSATSHLSQAERDRLSLRISTVDKFQGGEADVVLLSLVIAANSSQSTLIFLKRERRRLNVAVSRARALCIVLGDLANAKTCRIPHIEFLADRASRPWSPPRPQQFDSGWERRLYTAMQARGLEPHPQYPLGTRYLDFALFAGKVRLDVEVDGLRWHTDVTGNRKTADRLRDKEVIARGWKVLRFWVHELADDMEGCLDNIERELAAR